jgi:MFS transporter, DHA3 family, macrolide efflux protein
MQNINKRKQSTGMTAFSIVWFGQFVSLLGTGMTRFAITLWAWDQTGQATTLALVGFFAFAPRIIVTPFAGTIVDRSNRKLMMMVSDFGAGLSTIAMFILASNGNLQIWHIFLLGAFASVSEAFQFPAYSSAITMMVDKKQYARTSAMLGLAGSASDIIAPIMAAALYALIEIKGILLIDIITFSFALVTLLFVYIPQPPPSTEGEESKGSFLSETLYGFRYIWERRSLLGLQMLFFIGNFFGTICFVLIAPMILARTGNDEVILASVMSAFGLGGVVGGLAISVWGGPKRRVNGVIGGWILFSIGMILIGLARNQILWMASSFIAMSSSALINSSNQAIWQSKVPPDVQGRVFSVRVLVAQIITPLSMIVAGPLADKLFEPAMMPDGMWVNTFDQLVGVGAGAGLSLIFIFFGVLSVLVSVGAYMIPTIRNVEDIVPDHQDKMESPFEPEMAPSTD